MRMKKGRKGGSKVRKGGECVYVPFLLSKGFVRVH